MLAHRRSSSLRAQRSPLALAMVVALFAFTGVAAPDAARAESCAGWEAHPAPGGTTSHLRGVWVGPDGTAWAVGSDSDFGDSDDFSLTVFWDGATWTRVPSPNPGEAAGTDVILYTVDGVASDDVWALGTYKTVHDSGGWVGFQTVAFHWDGSAWTHVETPLTPPGGTGATFYGIEAVASDQVWAVGSRVAPDVGPPLVTSVGTLNLWDGSSWSEVSTTPILSPHRHELYDLEVFAPDDILVAGGVSDPDGYGPPENPYVLHWDGSDWTLQDIPTPGVQNFIKDLVAIARDDVWLVGYTWIEGSTIPYIVHWDGSDWTLVETTFDQPLGHLRAVAARAADDVWAVGVYTAEPPPAVGLKLTMHWDGSTWTQVPTDPEAPLDGTLWAIDDSATWTVGQQSGPGTAAQRRCGDIGSLIFVEDFESGEMLRWSGGRF